jgi:hypothetical protein
MLVKSAIIMLAILEGETLRLLFNAWNNRVQSDIASIIKLPMPN